MLATTTARTLRNTATRMMMARGSALPASSNLTQQQRRNYHENIVEHYENPRNVGSLDKNSDDVGTGLVGAPACGDVMKLQIKVDENGNIQESKFKTFGCGSAIASSSVVTEWVKGKHVDEVLAIKNTDIAAHLKLPPVKLHCSMLAEDAIRAAVSDWKAKKEGKVNAAA
ncbi:iron-sulfur cluster assembly scaffold protein [Skeletonema marinoi]|uniref:Iron-sulfur cluster assembly protein n=1 Tax=Skeletonema marinoi TaxID=267567 RepID=A0AAD8Y8K3_9STRA|nr:iron-sulfur cluster assembly scaffold protein [Skeletonema marinoi]